jgi:hypothetical protein
MVPRKLCPITTHMHTPKIRNLGLASALQQKFHSRLETHGKLEEANKLDTVR